MTPSPARPRTWLLFVAGIAALANVPRQSTASAPETATFEVGKEGRILLAPVRLGDEEWMFCLDTGASITVFDASLRSRLGEPQDDVTLRTSSGFSRAECFRCPEAYLGRWDLQKLGTVACVDLQGIRHATGEPVYGILGIDFLQYFAVEIDFDAGRVRIDTSAPETWTTESESIALVQGPGGIFWVNAELPDDQRELFCLDTGANGSALRRETFDRLSVRSEIAAGGRYRGVTVAGGIRGKSGYLSHISLGTFENENVRIDRDEINTLGLRLLSRYRMRIDFPGKRLLLDRGARFDSADPVATSGLSIIQIDGKKTVIAVEPGGPAAAEGIQAGDVITRVQGQDASSIDLFTLGGKLTSAPGAKVSLSILRGEVERECVLVLQSRIQLPSTSLRGKDPSHGAD